MGLSEIVPDILLLVCISLLILFIATLTMEEAMVEMIQAYSDSLPQSVHSKYDSYSYSRPNVEMYNRNEAIGAEFSKFTLDAFGTLPRNRSVSALLFIHRV